MEAIDLLKIIRENLDNNSEVEMTSQIMYDPIKIQYKVSFAVMERNTQGIYKSFMITVDDVKKHITNES
jgi:hypothetical protein